VPTPDRGLLARLDALVELAADRHGLALLSDGRLAAAEARVAAEAAGLGPPRPGRPPSAAGLDALDLLRTLAEAVGLLRVRGDRLEATALRPAWAQIDPGLRAGLVYAAWCHRVHWPALGRGGEPVAAVLAAGRGRVLRVLFGLPPGVDVGLADLAGTVADRLGVEPGDRLGAALAAAFLEPLVALGVAELDPAPPRPPARLRLGPRALTVIGSALVAAGEDVPLGVAGGG
jgi:hypothetical protein